MAASQAVFQHQGKQEREPCARPGGVLIGGDLAPEAVHDLDGDTRQQEQARGAIGSVPDGVTKAIAASNPVKLARRTAGANRLEVTLVFVNGRYS